VGQVIRKPDKQDIANWVTGLLSIGFITAWALEGNVYAIVLMAGMLALSITAITWFRQP
jgi:hypothetical protein